VALVGVELSVDERAEYVATEQQLVSARHHLRQLRGMPLEPFGDFLAAVAHLAERDAGPNGRAAREYLDAFSKRREIVAQSSASTSCWATSPARSAKRTGRWCSPKPWPCCETTQSTGSIHSCQST